MVAIPHSEFMSGELQRNISPDPTHPEQIPLRQLRYVERFLPTIPDIIARTINYALRSRFVSPEGIVGGDWFDPIKHQLGLFAAIQQLAESHDQQEYLSRIRTVCTLFSKLVRYLSGYEITDENGKRTFQLPVALIYDQNLSYEIQSLGQNQPLDLVVVGIAGILRSDVYLNSEELGNFHKALSLVAESLGEEILSRAKAEGSDLIPYDLRGIIIGGAILAYSAEIVEDTNRGQEVLEAHDLALTFGIKVDSSVTNEFLSDVVRPLLTFVLPKGNQVSLADEDFRTKIQSVLMTAKQILGEQCINREDIRVDYKASEEEIKLVGEFVTRLLGVKLLD